MQRYSNTITTAAGRAIVGAQIAVKTTSGALATIYADDGITTRGNPILSGVAGYFEFYAAPGAYSLTISGAGITANVVGVTLTTPPVVATPPAPDIGPLAAASGASLVGFQQAGAGAVLRNLQQMWAEALPTAEQFGAVGDGVANDTPKLQACLDAHQVVKLTRGKTYYLATPLKVSSGMAILGDLGRLAGFYSANTCALKPATCAIQTSDYTSQQVGFTLRNVGIVGGTVQVDLGLFHEVDIEGCEFFNPSVGALVIVRGEKNRIERCRVDAVSPGIFGFSVGRWAESLSTAYSDAFFAPDGAFFDRASIKDVHFQAGASGYFSYAIKSDILSNTTIYNLIEHGAAVAGEVSTLYVRTRMQACTLLDVNPDHLGTVGSPMTAMFDIAQALNCQFLSVSPALAGNNQYTKGFNIQQAYNTTFTGCQASGDNSATYGFYFGNAAGQVATLINCAGSFYHGSTNPMIRAQINQINCSFPVNNGGASNFSGNNGDMFDVLMADSNGAAASTAKWGARFAAGGGSSSDPFYVKKNAVYASAPLKFTNAFGEDTGPAIIVSGANNVLPEGNVTANPGSLYLFYNGTSAGKLYVKEVGNGNTGWVAK